MNKLQEKLKELPLSSGVYIMRDSDFNIIYIGKARYLKKRVSQYFSSYGTSSDKVMALMQHVADFNYIITPSEVDALILENNLIKKHKPYYNILLKDDKSYPFVRINTKEDFPRIEIVRHVSDDGARYFGPYMQGITTKDITELIYSAFPIRACKHNFEKLPKTHRACLNHHINRCLAPCLGKVTQDEYNEVVKNVIIFLNGNDNSVKKILTKKMMDCAENEEFELAMYYKERLKTLEKIVRKQVTYLAKDLNLDIFGIADNGVKGAVVQMFVRGGKLVGTDKIIIENATLNESHTLTEYISRYYMVNPVLCDEIICSVDLENQSVVEDYIKKIYDKKIKFVTPKAGVRKQLADMADKNASDFLINHTAKLEKREKLSKGAVEQLREKLEFKHKLRRIECYDISNISGTDKVASMVVFKNGVKASKHYRRFKIKTVVGADDFASLKETLMRRLERYKLGIEESFKEKPDLIIIDGGKGQLSSSLDAMRKVGVEIPMISLAKKEEIIIRENKPEVYLERNSLALHLIQRIRDEAHRFAITYHRLLRSKRQTRSKLLQIPDVGEARIKLLFEKFKTINKIKSASIDELMSINGIGKDTAEKIYNYFRTEEK